MKNFPVTYTTKWGGVGGEWGREWPFTFHSMHSHNRCISYEHLLLLYKISYLLKRIEEIVNATCLSKCDCYKYATYSVPLK